MFSRKAALLVVLILGIAFTSGALAMLGHTNGHSYGTLPPQIDAVDMMSNAWGLPDQKIENPI